MNELLGDAAVVEDLVDEYGAKEKSRKGSDNQEAIFKRLTAMQRKVRNLYEAVGKIGLTEGLSTAIKEAEAELQRLKAKVIAPTGERAAANPLRVRTAIREILETLGKDTESARVVLKKHIGTLVLTPTKDGYDFNGAFLLKLTDEAGRPFPGTPAEGYSTGVSGNSSSGGRI